MANFEDGYLEKEAHPMDAIWIFDFLLKRGTD
jgi:hypothetical protein